MGYKEAWIKRTRVWALTLLGEKCVRCGISENLEFDHVLAVTKSFEISYAISRGYSKARIEEELQKCQLLCRPCHVLKSKESGDCPGRTPRRIDEHGTEAYYSRTGCRCEPCRQARHDARVRRGEISDVQRRPPAHEHGCPPQGKRGCKCGPCKARKAEYMRNFRKNRAVVAQSEERRPPKAEVTGS